MDRMETLRGARAAPGWARLAGVIAALALASPAAAAPKAPAKIPLPPPPASTLGTAPAPRSVGAAVGAASGRALLVQLDLGVVRTPPSWRRLELEWHVIASFARPVANEQLTVQVVPPFGGTPLTVNAGNERVSALLFEVVPTARALYAPVPGVAFFGDAGVGLAQTVESFDRTEMYVGHSTRREYATGLVLRVAAGLAVDPAARWRVLLSPLAFDVMVGPKFTAWTPTLGVAYRL